MLLHEKFTVTSLNEPYAVLDLQSNDVIPGIGLIPAVPPVVYGFNDGAKLLYALEASPTPSLNFLFSKVPPCKIYCLAKVSLPPTLTPDVILTHELRAF